MEGIIFRTSFKPQNVRVMSVPEPSLLYRIIYVRRPVPNSFANRSAHGRACVSDSCFMKRLCPLADCLVRVFTKQQIYLFKTSPVCFYTGKTPHFNNAGATFTNWSTRGTYFPALCHISRKTKLNLTSFCSMTNTCVFF